MAGRNIIITGGSTGLGAALTKYFLTNGDNVAINYRSEAKLNSLLVEIENKNFEGNFLTIKADVRKRAEVKNMMKQAKTEFKTCDTLINCAGINRDKKFLDLTDKDWNSVVDTHLKGTFICSQEFIRNLEPNKGSIITIGANCGLSGRKNGANFCSSKGAIFALTKCMARELAPQIRVNCIVPSAILTDEVIERYSLDTDEGIVGVTKGLPIGRLGTTQEFVKMTEMIIQATYSTGQNFFVNGGELMQ